MAGGRSGACEPPVSRLVTGTHISLPLRVLHGPVDGPTVWLSAVVHGDEVAGVEIIRRVLANLDPRKLRGTVLAVTLVNGSCKRRAKVRKLPDEALPDAD